MENLSGAMMQTSNFPSCALSCTISILMPTQLPQKNLSSIFQIVPRSVLQLLCLCLKTPSLSLKLKENRNSHGWHRLCSLHVSGKAICLQSRAMPHWLKFWKLNVSASHINISSLLRNVLGAGNIVSFMVVHCYWTLKVCRLRRNATNGNPLVAKIGAMTHLWNDRKI